MKRNVTVDYGILTAVPQEMTHYYKLCENSEIIQIGNVKYTLGTINGKRVAMVPTGIGTTCAAAVMAHLVENFKPKAVFFTGTSGGIADGLQQGDVVVGTQAFEVEILGLTEACQDTPYNKDNYLIHSFKNEVQPGFYNGDSDLIKHANKLAPTFQSNALIHNKDSNAIVHFGLLATINHFPLNSIYYHSIKKRNTVAVAMEGSAIYQTSWLLGIPSLVVRGVSNIYSKDGSVSNIHTSEISLASGNAAKFVMHLLSSIEC
jgi:nucleoside phosphorylase